MPYLEGSTRPIKDLSREVTEKEYQDILESLESFADGNNEAYETLGDLAGDLRVVVVLAGDHLKGAGESGEAYLDSSKYLSEMLDPYLLDCQPAVTPDFLIGHVPEYQAVVAAVLGTRPVMALKFFGKETSPLIHIDFTYDVLEFGDNSQGEAQLYDLSLSLGDEELDPLRAHLAVAVGSVAARLKEIDEGEDFSSFEDLDFDLEP